MIYGKVSESRPTDVSRRDQVAAPSSVGLQDLETFYRSRECRCSVYATVAYDATKGNLGFMGEKSIGTCARKSVEAGVAAGS